jgi:hypothetical protein
MQTKNKVLVRGTPKIEKVYPDGTRVLHYQDENIIVLTAKQVLLSGLYLTGQTSDPVSTLWVGTGGTVDPGGQFPKPVSQNQASLFTPLISVSTSYTVDNTMPSVTFIADLDQSTANGSLITEAGLFKKSGAIFNIKTFPGIPKTAEFSVHFEWEIEMS